MTHDTSVSLGEHLARFVDRQVEDGRYASASDVVRAGLRLLEERETRLDALRSALAEGEAGGDFQEFEIGAFLDGMPRPAAP